MRAACSALAAGAALNGEESSNSTWRRKKRSAALASEPRISTPLSLLEQGPDPGRAAAHHGSQHAGTGGRDGNRRHGLPDIRFLSELSPAGLNPDLCRLSVSPFAIDRDIAQFTSRCKDGDQT